MHSDIQHPHRQDVESGTCGQISQLIYQGALESTVYNLNRDFLCLLKFELKHLSEHGTVSEVPLRWNYCYGGKSTALFCSKQLLQSAKLSDDPF